MISRDWHCLNRNCRKIFHSYERGNPECPHCGCVRVTWVPGGGHIGKVAPGADRTLRSLAADYGLTNLNSASPSRIPFAKPIAPPPVTGSLGVKHWAPGFSSEVFPNVPHCTTSMAGVHVKGFQVPGRQLSPSVSIAGPALDTHVARRYRP